MLDCSIVIVAYHSGDDLKKLLPTLEASVKPLTWHVTIVNNAADENLEPVVRDHVDRVTVVDAPGNLGYSGGLNLGLQCAPQARHLVFLNPDLMLEPGALRVLVGELEGGTAGAVPLILGADGAMQLSLRREPTLLSALGDAFLGAAFPRRPGWLSETVRDTSAYRAPHDVDWATGAVLAVRADVAAQVGDWDDGRFFLYSEETDYARRVRAQGGRIRFVPEAVVRHRGAGSGASAQLEALLEINKLRYFRKWHPPLAVGAFGLVRLLHNAVRLHRPGSRSALRALLSPSQRAKLPGPRKVWTAP